MQLKYSLLFLACLVSAADLSDIDELKAQLVAQQEQINQLRNMVDAQQRLLERMLPAQPAPIEQKKEPPSPHIPQQAKGLMTADAPAPDSPLTISLGQVHITPLGFVDFTAMLRNKTVASGLPTNFGALPFSDTVNGNLSEYRLSSQHSRLGARIDTRILGTNLTGYLETDFLGFVPGNATVTSNSDGLRLRLYFLDLRKDKFEGMAGQSWSLLTPGRRGISPLPSDLFSTQNLDPNYQVGLVWARDPQLRFVYHPTQTVAMAVSLESAEQYGGGSSGAAAITLPSKLVSSYSNQLNLGSGGVSIPSPNQDVIAKVAFDPSAAVHAEFAGVLRRFAFYNPLTDRSFRATGGGVSFNASLELIKNLRLYTNNYYSNGGGRYVFGLGPDLIINDDGSPSLVRAMSTVTGVEYQLQPKTLFYAYYGGAYFKRAVALDYATGLPVGFGYSGSPDGHNRAIQQATAGLSRVFWRNPSFGTLQFGAQYSYIFRNPWYAAPGHPASATLNTVYLNLRYLLPGSPPSYR